MDLKYDQKFEEMKKYIPFLESMIKRLESTGCSSSNPRQAQLDKIRSLRDLLLDKKKRMKMENLLKCEQVLLNLYAKVEQRDTLPGIKKASDSIFSTANNPNDKSQLDAVRSKFRAVTSITNQRNENVETLPEIARANDAEVVCTSGSKEPALFQRRPNISSLSPSKLSTSKSEKSPQKSLSKRNYTRVLVSPEPSPRHWSPAAESTTEKPLFKRRSPRRSPRRRSPLYKKEKKKSSNQPSKTKSKDLNITLNVPEESLSSLNTEDILSRIINCSDSDVDIDTLRDLRSQILGELKQTGASEDISDLIMKSYKKKTPKQKTEIEEGELSDSESEAIESIYGSLVLVDKDNSCSSNAKPTTDKENQARKIQICLVINSDKDNKEMSKSGKPPSVTEISDFEMFDDDNPNIHESKDQKTSVNKTDNTSNKGNTSKSVAKLSSQFANSTLNTQEIITIDDDEELNVTSKENITKTCDKESNNSFDIPSCRDLDIPTKTTQEEIKSHSQEKTKTLEEEIKTVPFKPNFYKPLNEQESISVSESKNKTVEIKVHTTELNPNDQTKTINEKNDLELLSHNNYTKSKEVIEAVKMSEASESTCIENNKETMEIPQIPLLNMEQNVPVPPVKKGNVSEIDILQALKNEILSETIAIPGAEIVTPLLHQPKITKVSSSQEITKKRISIEKYKEKSVNSTTTPLFIKEPYMSMSKDDYSKKQSLKLTEKECERFNFPSKIAVVSSDEEDKDKDIINLDDYENLAPKSPENEEMISSDKAPVIIPVDPVKSSVVASHADVDMRQLVPLLSPNSSKSVSEVLPVSKNKPEHGYRPPPVDPRIRRDYKQPLLETPKLHTLNPDRTPIPPVNYGSLTPNLAQSRTPNMTPNARTYDMTPHQSFEIDEQSSRKHVYAPIFPLIDSDQRETIGSENQRIHRDLNQTTSEVRKSRWETDGRDNNNQWEPRGARGTPVHGDTPLDHQHSRYKDTSDNYQNVRNQRYNKYDKRDEYLFNRSECPRTPLPAFGRSECPSTPIPSFGRLDTPMTPVHSFGRSECPTTPTHPFGRTDCPLTPSHPFGRSDCPTTPSHPFGRSDCPTTPSHPFGRSDCPSTPNHPFGRSDVSLTPSHQFGRSDVSLTPSHQFGRSDASLTPSHQFGRSDAPMTPNHQFGRSDAPMTPTHSFGRSDYSHNSAGKFAKDPRFKRSNDYETTSRNYDDDKERGYYKDRRKSDVAHTSESYHNLQQQRRESVGRNERSSNYVRENVGERQYSRESEQLYTRDRGQNRTTNDYNYGRNLPNFNQVGSRGHRAQSMGRDEHHSVNNSTIRRNSRDINTLSVKPQSGRSFIIDTSVNRTFQDFLVEKGLQVIDYSFDARRQRATSVGRTLIRENSIGRTFRESSIGRNLSKPPVQSMENQSRRDFTRARSVGRDMVQYREEKSFKDIKADFEAYSAKSKNNDSNHVMKSNETIHNRNSRKIKDLSGTERRNEMTKTYATNTKSVYSPRKNYRDPRLRREQNDTNKHRTNDRSRDRKNYGIVYSNDNIAKGVILGSGYGVKNYKIPKIKRATEEKPNIEKQNDEASSEVRNDKDTKKKQIKKTDQITTSQDKDKKHTENIITKTSTTKKLDKSNDISKRGNKFSNKNDSDSKLNKDVVKPKRHKKPIISDSDSDTNSNSKKDIQKTDTDDSKITQKHDKEANDSKTALVDKNIVSKIDRENLKSVSPKQNDINQDELLDHSFGIDDLEIPDNITALIADLDNDIGDSKTDKNQKFTNVINFGNMLDNICSPDDTNLTMEESLKDLADLINSDLKESDSKSKQTSSTKTLELNEETIKEPDKTSNGKSEDVTIGIKSIEKQESITLNVANSKCKSKVEEQITKDSETTPVAAPMSDLLHPEKILQKDIEKNIDNNMESIDALNLDIQESVKQNLDVNDSKNNEEIVSTTRAESPVKPENKLLLESPKKNIDVATDRSSTPDSTINTYDCVQIDAQTEELPDSTNEFQNDMHSDITSTHDSLTTSANVPGASSAKEKESPIDSIGNLLSMLQDKSKIKKLLSMLGEQNSENEKIKKKLEKLSEIVSDEEDTNDGLSVPVTEKKLTHDLEVNKTLVNDSTILKQQEHLKENKKLVEIDEQDAHDKSVHKFNDDTETSKQSNEDTDLKVNKPRKSKICRKRTKQGKWVKKKTNNTEKRITRSDAANLCPEKPKKASRELKQLQDSLKEMFLSDDILNISGIRMCRLAKLVEDKTNPEEVLQISEAKPVVVLEKFKDSKATSNLSEKIKKKPGPKPKVNSTEDSVSQHNKPEPSKSTIKYKPGPKSKTKSLYEGGNDPYAFDSDTGIDINTKKLDENKDQTSSDYDSDSMSSCKSFGSSEALMELKKKPKRRRPGWQAGVIKQKKRKKTESKSSDTLLDDNILVPQRSIIVPDMNCFTDKSYCFLKNVSKYPCRLCDYNGSEIVHHYKMQHPHSEIPLSRMNEVVAHEAIEQCEEINFQAIRKISTDRYTCRFCFKTYSSKRTKVGVLESFFWHIVSTHTGEYKQLCSECINMARCPFNLDIPPPPKDVKGQLIGYICGKCYFTQISLENLKTHVIVRHNDEQTEVYTINLAVMTKKNMNTIIRGGKLEPEEPVRVLRSSRSNQSVTEASEDHSDITESIDRLSGSDSIRRKTMKGRASFETLTSSKVNMQSKITFETEDNMSTSDISNVTNTESGNVKMESDNEENLQDFDNSNVVESDIDNDDTDRNSEVRNISDDIVDLPHFKISYNKSGAKEYICCINGADNHYKTTLLISLKKHIQFKHSEKWDGYCYVCKLIVTSQGEHNFKECLQHLLDQHIDNFPILERASEEVLEIQDEPIAKTPDLPALTPIKKISTKSYINVRPLAELICNEAKQVEQNSDALPKIQSVVSLGLSVEPSLPSPTYPVTQTTSESTVPEKYEEVQADVMSKKHQVVLETMMSSDKLVRIFKCAGRYCYFTSDSAEESLLHASTHQRIGGENALICAYCNFNCHGNAIDLVTHVFNAHGCCQYVCKHCFYRAAASQLVRAHMIRVHGEALSQDNVLKTATVTSSADSTSNMLSRDVAVKYYTCADVASNCKFKTYIRGKFVDHITKHDSPFLCYICEKSFESTTELIQHLELHGLKLFQCTWCIYGAANEAVLLAHASARHPSKQPQAYVRVITSKDGSSKMMVLPLAQYNKSVIPTEIVTPAINTENAVREAERSIELEKLIASMDILSNSIVNTNEPTSEVNLNPVDESFGDILEEMDEIPEPIQPSTPTTSAEDDLAHRVTPILKTEPVETRIESNSSQPEVICLDSDEEDSRQNVIDLSDDIPSLEQKDATTPKETYEHIPISRLYMCPKTSCKARYKKPHAFKRHILQSCYPLSQDNIKCFHCPLILNGIDEICYHYENDHGSGVKNIPQLRQPKRYDCTECDFKNQFLLLVKNHMKSVHNIADIAVSLSGDKGANIYAVHKVPKPSTNSTPNPKQLSKRKLSDGSGVEMPSKKKRYGPEDVDQLPTKPILDELVYCALCEFNSKVRINVVRHLQCHAQMQPVPQTVPVNPVPHLETNEKHFDKMVNLASSSVITRGPDKPTRTESTPTVSLLLPPEAASRYPKYIPERQRLTCGAKDCSYTSVDEAMFKCHWDTLHAGTNDYHCVHCPPYQHLDTSKPLTASRVIGHLKMHDVQLYACSSCSYYHYKRQVLDKHLAEVHKSAGRVMVVREEAPAQPLTHLNQSLPSAAPTMDLKPWQCGLCKFKSMLRQEVIEHCSITHNSKMQFKCPNCPFRASTIENVMKHRSNAHPASTEDVVYYYYREGSVPDAPDGTPLWMKQRQKMGNTTPEVKEEVPDNSVPNTSETLPVPAAPINIDLNIVKKEVVDPENEESIEDLCKTFGQFCDPNGLKFKCPFCKIVTEDTREAMQSHLYEELQYRKWGCSMCSYKAFHKTGLNDHMASEHRQNREPLELPVDTRVEKWVLKLLEHQTLLIEKIKENFAKHRISFERRPPAKIVEISKINIEMSTKSQAELERAFGKLGNASDMNFCCPKCDFKTKDEILMQNHLESELNKIRWLCSNCAENFQEYHEAQLHAKSVHARTVARPLEAIRDPSLRAAWVNAVLRTQKQTMNIPDLPTKKTPLEVPPAIENPLLVVRYEEKVPTPEEEMLLKRKRPAPTAIQATASSPLLEEMLLKRKRSAPTAVHAGVSSPTPEEEVLLKRKRTAPTSVLTASISPTVEEEIILKRNRPASMSVHPTASSPIPEEEVLLKCKQPAQTTVHAAASLLVPEEETLLKRKSPTPVHAAANSDSDEEKLVIDEATASSHAIDKQFDLKQCPYCDFSSKYKTTVYDHILRHYNLKPVTCTYCGITCHVKGSSRHAETHSPKPFSFVKTQIPPGPPITTALAKKGRRLLSRSDDDTSKVEDSKGKDDGPKLICLVCEKSMTVTETQSHTHGDTKAPHFARRGDVVVKCCNCFILVLTVADMIEHHEHCHPNVKVNYAYYKLHYDTRESLCCGHCDKRFKFIRDLRSHHNAVHKTLRLKFAKSLETVEYNEEGKDAGSSDITLIKRVARKSTSKLPNQSVAKKSTTKLPFVVESDSESDEEYSFYGTKPTPLEQLDKVTTLMPFCNTIMSFTVKKLSEIIKMDPRVIVDDVRK